LIKMETKMKVEAVVKTSTMILPNAWPKSHRFTQPVRIIVGNCWADQWQTYITWPNTWQTGINLYQLYIVKITMRPKISSITNLSE